jgi:hypothetical protein
MTKNSSFASPAMRLLAAASLACVAAVGCSTDRTPGAGQPGRYEPSVGPTMPSATPGSEQNRPLNPPMISSYTAPNAVMPQHPNLDALAIAAANQSFRGRYLGVADPGGVPSYTMNAQAQAPAPVYETGQFINPSDSANPEITVNRSISSSPTPVVASGGTGVFVGTTGGVAITAPAGTSAAITSGITTTPTTAATTLTPTVAANSVATNVSTASASNAAAAVIDNRGGLLTPTMTSGATPSPTVAANPGVGNVRTGTTVATTANTTSTVTSTTSRLNTSVAASGSLVIGRSANGTVVITNTDRAVTTSRSSAPTLKFQ